MTAKIGFLGLGTMGRWMALNMLKAGYGLKVYDINPAAIAFLAKEGAQAGTSPADAASGADWLFLSLPDTEIVERALFGEAGAVASARPGTAIVDLSTIGYMATLEIDRRLRDKGIRFADAPVSGMEARAREAKITVMFGGEASLFEEVRPALEAIGNQIVYMGPVGSGQLTKLINQILFDINCAGLAEVLPMAAKLGLDPQKVAQVVTTGTGRSFAAEFFIPLILQGTFEEGYPVKAAYKDLISAAEISAHKAIPLPLTNATAVTFQMALAEGFGALGKGGLIRVFEKLIGAEFRSEEEKP